MKGLNLGGAHRAALAHLFFEVKQASVAAFEVELPTWRAPLVVRVRGVRVELQQRNMPTVGYSACTLLHVHAYCCDCERV